MRKIILLLILTTAFAVAQDKQKFSKMAQSPEYRDYVNVQQLNKAVQVSLIYARAGNFTDDALRDDLREAYLHPHTTQAPVRAQKQLKELRPNLQLKTYDAARPMSIRRKIWDKVEHTSKYFYVSNLARGGDLHNYGLTVDLTLYDLKGDILDMGTKIDYMGRVTHIDNEAQLVAHGRISRQARKDRQLLRDVMTYAGFKPSRTEWWYFNFRSWAQAKRYYQVIE